MRPLRTLTVWQPWATFIVMGAKPIEFRPRPYFQYVNPPRTGDRIVIHAGLHKESKDEMRELLLELRRGNSKNRGRLVVDLALPVMERWSSTGFSKSFLPMGFGIGEATLGRPIDPSAFMGRQLTREELQQANWAWPMLDPVQWRVPVPAKGERGFFFWKHEVEQREAA